MSLKVKLCLCLAVLLGMLLSGCSQGGGVSVPIKVENADHLSAIAFNLLYDTEVFEVSGVDLADLTRNPGARWGREGPGKIVVVVENADISGDGILVEVKCDVTAGTGLSTLTIEVQEARNVAGELLEPQVYEGSLSAENKAVEPPVVVFSS